jgi:hypothetical protein
MFKPGSSGNPTGRPTGAKDKTQADIKQAYQTLVEGNLSNIETWLKDVAAKDPAKAIELMLRLSAFILPKMKATEITASGNDGAAVSIQFRDFQAEREKEMLAKLSTDDLRTLIEIQTRAGIL